MATTTHRRGFTLLELLIAITIFLILAGLSTYVFINVSKAVNRTTAVIQLHQEAAAVIQRLEEDLMNLQPGAAVQLRERDLTFVRAHGEALGLETRHVGTQSGRYAHDLIWVRWQWDDALLRRAATPPMPADDGSLKFFNNTDNNGSGSSGSGVADGRSAAPQQFIEYLEPDALPDRSDPALDDATLRAQVQAFSGSLATMGARQLDTGIYWRPSKVWWFPGEAQGYGRGVPAAPMALEFGMLTEETGDPITSITYTAPAPYAAGSADAPETSFAVVNQRGYSVNRDYANLMGTHPDNPYPDKYPSQLALVSDKVLNLRVALLGNDWAAGDLTTWGGTKSALLRGDAELGSGGFAGIPLNPSADNAPGIGGLKGGRLPELTRSRDFDQRPVKAEIAFVAHTIPSKEDDEFDYDGDGDRAERLAAAVWQAASAAAAPGAVPTADIVRRIEDLGFVAVPFTHVVELP